MKDKEISTKFLLPSLSLSSHWYVILLFLRGRKLSQIIREWNYHGFSNKKSLSLSWWKDPKLTENITSYSHCVNIDLSSWIHGWFWDGGHSSKWDIWMITLSEGLFLPACHWPWVECWKRLRPRWLLLLYMAYLFFWSAQVILHFPNSAPSWGYIFLCILCQLSLKHGMPFEVFLFCALRTRNMCVEYSFPNHHLHLFILPFYLCSFLPFLICWRSHTVHLYFQLCLSVV